MVLEGLLVYISVVVLYFLHYFLGNILVDRPIIVGTIVGLVLGDLQTGIIVGASYELIFLGAVNAGGVVPSNTAIGTSIGVALTILTGMDYEASLAIAVPAATLGASLTTLMYTLRSMMNPYVEGLVEKADYKKIERFVFIQGIVSYLVLMIPVFLVVAFGGDIVNDVVAWLPSYVTGGLSVASGMLAAVGFGMLLKLVWTKSLAVYFFVGYLLSAYLGLPILGVALAGALYVIILFIDNKEQQNKIVSNIVGTVEEEGELFND